MKITLFGATGSIGRVVLREALLAGHDVRVYGRTAPADAAGERLQLFRGELADQDAMVAAIRGADAVVSTLGARSRADIDPVAAGVSNIIAAMKRADVRRLVSISGAGVKLPGDERGLIDRVMAAIAGLVVPHMIACKLREHELIARSELDWTVVRPPGLTNKPATGKIRVDKTRPPGMMISRADLSTFILAQLTDRTFVGEAPFVAG